MNSRSCVNASSGKQVTRTEGISVRAMTRTGGISGRVIRMLRQLVGLSPVERANVTRTEGMSVRVIRMLGQLISRFSVERASVFNLYRKYVCRGSKYAGSAS